MFFFGGGDCAAAGWLLVAGCRYLDSLWLKHHDNINVKRWKGREARSKERKVKLNTASQFTE